MRIVIAPDSFKHSLPALAVADNIAIGIKKIFPEAEIILVPLADGGEGTVKSLIDATNGHIENLEVHDPLLRKVNSFLGILGDDKTAVIEMAAASGIELLNNNELNPMTASTYGTGELIKKALDLGCNKIIVGIGGSATNDGGIGMARALGVKFFDENNNEIGEGGGSLNRLALIDHSGIDQRLKHCEILIAADVNNPLTGPTGASRVFAPQKGADINQVEILEKNISHFAAILRTTYNKDFENLEGAGAAGGLGVGLMAFANARIMSGFKIIAEITELESKISRADLVITGEGKIDNQTLFGKTPFGVAMLAKKYNKPVIAFAGSLGEKHEDLYQIGFDVIFPITDQPMPLEYALKNAERLLQEASERMARMLVLSGKMK